MKRYLAELIGTFVLVFAGVGSAVLGGGRIGNTGVSLAFGFALLAMVYTIGPISGCHINPAVTLGALLTKKIEPRDAGIYVIVQLCGAIAAAAVILLIASGAPSGHYAVISGLGANGYASHSPSGYSMSACLFAEIILTMFLVLTVLCSSDSKAPAGFGGIPIGFMLIVIHLIGIPITNTSVNPARSFGPALIVGGWALKQLWLFIIAPLVGSVFAAITYTAISSPVPMMIGSTSKQDETFIQQPITELRHIA